MRMPIDAEEAMQAGVADHYKGVYSIQPHDQQQDGHTIF